MLVLFTVAPEALSSGLELVQILGLAASILVLLLITSRC